MFIYIIAYKITFVKIKIYGNHQILISIYFVSIDNSAGKPGNLQRRYFRYYSECLRRQILLKKGGTLPGVPFIRVAHNSIYKSTSSTLWANEDIWTDIRTAIPF